MIGFVARVPLDAKVEPHPAARRGGPAAGPSRAGPEAGPPRMATSRPRTPDFFAP